MTLTKYRIIKMYYPYSDYTCYLVQKRWLLFFWVTNSAANFWWLDSNYGKPYETEDDAFKRIEWIKKDKIKPKEPIKEVIKYV